MAFLALLAAFAAFFAGPYVIMATDPPPTTTLNKCNCSITLENKKINETLTALKQINTTTGMNSTHPYICANITVIIILLENPKSRNGDTCDYEADPLIIAMNGLSVSLIEVVRTANESNINEVKNCETILNECLGPLTALVFAVPGLGGAALRAPVELLGATLVLITEALANIVVGVGTVVKGLLGGISSLVIGLTMAGSQCPEIPQPVIDACPGLIKSLTDIIPKLEAAYKDRATDVIVAIKCVIKYIKALINFLECIINDARGATNSMSLAPILVSLTVEIGNAMIACNEDPVSGTDPVQTQLKALLIVIKIQIPGLKIEDGLIVTILGLVVKLSEAVGAALNSVVEQLGDLQTQICGEEDPVPTTIITMLGGLSPLIVDIEVVISTLTLAPLVKQLKKIVADLKNVLSCLPSITKTDLVVRLRIIVDLIVILLEKLPKMEGLDKCQIDTIDSLLKAVFGLLRSVLTALAHSANNILGNLLKGYCVCWGAILGGSLGSTGILWNPAGGLIFSITVGVGGLVGGVLVVVGGIVEGVVGAVGGLLSGLLNALFPKPSTGGTPTTKPVPTGSGCRGLLSGLLCKLLG